MTENQLRYLSHLEQQRHNLAMEQDAVNKTQESQRSNLARESIDLSKTTEIARANRAAEELRDLELAFRYDELTANAALRQAKTAEASAKALKDTSAVATDLLDALIPG